MQYANCGNVLEQFWTKLHNFTETILYLNARSHCRRSFADSRMTRTYQAYQAPFIFIRRSCLRWIELLKYRPLWERYANHGGSPVFHLLAHHSPLLNFSCVLACYETQPGSFASGTATPAHVLPQRDVGLSLCPTHPVLDGRPQVLLLVISNSVKDRRKLIIFSRDVS